MNNIGVFCAASDRLDAHYYELAEQFGKWLGENGKTLVYGGANSGLMESIAKGVKSTGGTVVGIVPRILETKRRASTYIDEIVPCVDLNDRKAILIDRSDVLVALPGGVGTLDEIFTVMASHSIGYHTIRVVLFNLDGFWDGVIEVLHELDRKHFVNVPLDRYLSVASSWEELFALL